MSGLCSLFPHDGDSLQGDVQMQIRAHHREALISEISNLVHSQLVTSTLESNFRGELEVMMQVSGKYSYIFTCHVGTM